MKMGVRKADFEWDVAALVSAWRFHLLTKAATVRPCLVLPCMNAWMERERSREPKDVFFAFRDTREFAMQHVPARQPRPREPERLCCQSHKQKM